MKKSGHKRSIFKKRTTRPPFVLAVLVQFVRLSFLTLLIAALAGIGAIVGIAKGYVETAPVLDLAKIDEQAETSFFYDRNGKLITDFKGTEDRIMVSIAAMPDRLQKAFVAVEDSRFYTHKGVDIKRIIGAFIKNFTTGSQQGGSTITQQLIKNTVLTNEVSYKRKIQEAYLAMQLEAKYTKDEILESYLNTIYLGENYYGVKVAALGYFGKELHELTLRECAMLAGLTTNPYRYNPRRNYYLRSSESIDYRAITNNRTDYALRQMMDNQFITREEYEQALNPATANVLEKSGGQEMYPYAHYVEYAVSDVVQTFLKMRGLENTRANRNLMENELRTGGYKVYLALDTEIQQLLEDTLAGYDSYPALRDPQDKTYRSANKDGTYEEIVQPQAAAVVIDYRTGELKAIVGSRTPPTQRRTLNRATDMDMPVGSAIKPLGVYAPAFELGAGAGSIAYNMPLPIEGWRGADGKDSFPKNYGGGGYTGPETLRTALVKSYNTATAQALQTYVGVERSADFLLRLGVSPKRIDKTPFGVALGSSGITPLEMTVAFGVLGNGGVYQQPLSFIGILDRDDNIIYDAHQHQDRRQVFNPATSWLTIDILKEAVSRGTGRSAQIKGQTVAGKTGTNSDQRGVFFSGLTGWYASSIWIGHDNYKQLSSKTTGGNSAAKLWQKYMSAIHQQKGLGNRDILEGDSASYGLVRVTTCKVSGQLATDACRNDINGYGTVTDYYPSHTVPTVSCQMHRQMQVCMMSGMAVGPYCPPESVTVKSAVILPTGHPLEKFIGTSYEGVLRDYLGNAIVSGVGLMETCNVHLSPQIEEPPEPEVSGLYGEAVALLETASGLLGQYPADTPGYVGLIDAINQLNSVLSTNDDMQIYTAMYNLTQAMANLGVQ